MLGAAEVVRDIVVVDAALGGRGTALDVLRISLPAVASDIGSERAACDSAADGGDVLSAPATDLVAENAAYQCADDGSGDIGATSFLRALLMLDPAALLGGSEHLAHRRHVGVEDALVVAALVVVHGDRFKSSAANEA